MNTDTPFNPADAILNTAVDMAEHTSWETLHLYQVAQKMGISIDELHHHFATKDDLVEAWYDRADSAMLHTAGKPGFHTLSYRERLFSLILAWLGALADHKTVSRDMLLYKLEPAHIHLQIQGMLRISRTVQLLREAARMQRTHLQRIIEEIGLTGIFVNTFVYWMFDKSARQTNTFRFLEKQLNTAERMAGLVFRGKRAVAV